MVVLLVVAALLYGYCLGGGLELVPLPGLVDVDRPLPEDLPLFVDHLIAAIERALDAPPLPAVAPRVLEPFT
ncbi:MAG: hypothetical protein P8090_09810, partial [Gammaproteobacteria bacterium]